MTSDLRSPWSPEWGVPPGEILVEALQERGMTQAELARRMARPLKTISEIATGKAAITPETAIQLERAVGISASFWNGLEVRYREAVARARATQELEQDVGWLSNFPLADMLRLNLLPPTAAETETLGHLLAFFGVSNPSGWNQQWGRTTAALRSSRAHRSSPHALAAWLRWGEIEAAKIDARHFNEERFRQVLVEARTLTRLASFGLAVSRLQGSLATAGVALVVVPELSGTRVSGAARWLRPNFALIQLSLRYLADDQFWFSLFHEAGHVLAGRRRVDYVEDIDPNAPSGGADEEEAANAFARDHLIPPDDYRRFRQTTMFTVEEVRQFAEELGISPGIVVGRLQYDRALPPSRMNHLKRRYVVTL